MKNSGPASSTDASQCISHNLLIISEPQQFPYGEWLPAFSWVSDRGTRMASQHFGG